MLLSNIYTSAKCDRIMLWLHYRPVANLYVVEKCVANHFDVPRHESSVCQFSTASKFISRIGELRKLDRINTGENEDMFSTVLFPALVAVTVCKPVDPQTIPETSR